jgi:ribonucleoside-diphosphate reductase alpha chain
MFFLDRAQEGNTTPTLGSMDATNPCGEQPLIPFETCNMGHINLSKIVLGFPLVDNDNIQSLSLEEKFKLINWDLLKSATKTSIRFLDNIIDVNNYPIPEIENMTKKTRNIGLGVMGFADMLVKLGIVYGSDESLKLIEKVMGTISEMAHQASVELGKEKGNFPAFTESTWYQNGEKYLRNTRVTTIAPTGTISIIGNCNPGIEPIFSLGYRRKNSMGGTDQEVIDGLIEQVAKAKGFYTEKFKDKISNGEHLFDLQDEFDIPTYIVNVFKTTHEINPEDHVRIQATFQKYVDSAVSKTINLPNNATWQDIARVYMLSYDLGCKGMTVFRDGSKDPALQVGTKKKIIETNIISPVTVELANHNSTISINNLPKMETPRNMLEPRKRAMMTKGFTYEVKTEQGDLYITVNEDDKGIVEIFLNLGKSGSFTAGYTEALGRLISMSLRAGIKPEAIIKQLQGIRTSTPTLNKGMIVYSVPDAIAKILKRHLDGMQGQIELIPPQSTKDEAEPLLVGSEVKTTYINETSFQSSQKEEEQRINILQNIIIPAQNNMNVEEEKSKYSKNNEFGSLLECPDCGGDLEYSEGCILCRACGYSKCG